MPQGTGFGGSGGTRSTSRGSGFGGGTAKAQKSDKKAGPKKASLLGQLTDIVKATPSGLWNLTKAVGAEFDPLQRKTLAAMNDPNFKNMSAAERRMALSPATAGVAESAGRTAGDIRHPSRFVKAAKEGQIVGKVIEDAANLSLVAGPVGKAAGAGSRAAATGSAKAAAAGNVSRAARLSRVESALRTTQQVARGAEHAANLTAGAGDPVFLTTRVARGTGKVLKSDAVKKSALGAKVAERAESFSERRSARQDLANMDADIAKEADRQGRIVARQKALLSDVEIEATTLVRQGESKALERLDSLPTAERQRVLDAVFADGRKVSAEAFDLARSYEKGSMPTEQAGRFSEAISIAETEQAAPRTARAVAGVGRKEGPLSNEQLGDQPLTNVVEGAVYPLRQKAAKAGERAVSLRRQADRAEQQAATVRDQTAALATERAEFNARAKPATKRALNTPGESQAVGAANMRARILGNVATSAEARAGRLTSKVAAETRRVSESIEAAPKRWRPALTRAADSAAELRRMAKDADAAGDTHSAAYLRAVADDLPKVIADLKALNIDPSHLIGGDTPRLVGVAGKKQRFATLRKTGGEKQSRTTNINRSAEGQGRLEANRAAESIKNVAAVDFRAKYARTADDLGFDPALTGDELRTAALQAGYKPFDPAPLLEGPQKVDRSTTFIRTAMADDFSRWFDNARPGNIVGALHKINRAMSIPILRLSPRWQIGNAVSQAMQMTVGAGLTPAQIAKYGLEARRLMKEAPDQVPARFGHSGQFSGLLSPELDALGRPLRTPRTPVGKLAEKSGQMNEWVDRWGKETVYLAKKAKGYSDEAAVRRALELQVDMRSLSNFERNYVQAVLPYYAWAKHITKLSLRLPLEHPTRIAWTLHLADLYGDDQSQLPEWLKGGVRLEDGRFVNVGSVVNPFGDVAQSPLLSPGGALSAVSPALRLVGAALNVDVPKAQLLKRPVGTGPLDASGDPRLGPIAPSELANVAAQSLPQTRLLTGLKGTPVSRYPTGDPYLDAEGNRYPTERTRLNMLGRFVGIPTPERIDAEEITASQQAGLQRTLKSRENYEKRRRGESTKSARGKGFGNSR